MSECNVIIVDLDSVYPSQLGRKTPAEARRPTLDWSVVDCAGTGVTVTNSTWAIHPDDADGNLVLDQDALSGFLASVRGSAGLDGSTYRLANTVTTSDGRTLVATVVLPVFETRAIAA